MAREYAGDGVSLILMGRDEARLANTAQDCEMKGAQVEIIAADVQDREAMARSIEAADARAPIDLVVANAGVATGLSTGEVKEDPGAVRAAFAINVIGAFNTVEPLILPMRGRGRGGIALVGSMAGVRGLPYSPAYCATKAAIHSYAESLRGVLAPCGVGVALIIPGFVDTPMAARTKSWQPGKISAEQAARLIRRRLDAGAKVVAFPLFMYVALRLFRLAPSGVVDACMRRFRADVPQTRERAAS